MISPPLMAQYLEIASSVADTILPPRQTAQSVEAARYTIGPSGLTAPKNAGGAKVGEAFRLVSSRNMASAAAWPSRFEAPVSGFYRLTIQATAFQTSRMFYEKRSEPFQIEVYARPNAQQTYAPFGDLRRLATLELSHESDDAHRWTSEVTLFAGEVFGIRWVNGPAFSDPPSRLFSTRFLADRLTRDRPLYAALLKLNGQPRGSSDSEFYQQIQSLIQGGDLDLQDPRLDQLPEKWGGGLEDAPHNWIKAYVYEELYRHGPAVDVLNADVVGPLRLVDDEITLARRKRTKVFLGDRGNDESDAEYVSQVLGRYLKRRLSPTGQ